MKIPKLVISTFRKFGDYSANVGHLVANELCGGLPVEGYVLDWMDFGCFIPPRGENRGKILMDHAVTIGASGILSLGMDSSRTGVCVETSARNLINCPKYCPILTGTKINSQLPAEEEVNVNLDPWCVEKVPSLTLSDNAGGFCCNHLIWQVRQTQLAVAESEYRNLPFCFLHLPCSYECVKNREGFIQDGKKFLPLEEMVDSVRTLIRVAKLSPQA